MNHVQFLSPNWTWSSLLATSDRTTTDTDKKSVFIPLTLGLMCFCATWMNNHRRQERLDGYLPILKGGFSSLACMETSLLPFDLDPLISIRGTRFHGNLSLIVFVLLKDSSR